jgi:glycosyltransferase involved in cell wall biosynthesis
MKISIITVCYNSEKYIRSAMESVLSQTYENIEYIVVDGNSTDRTLEFVKAYEPKFNGKMRWVSEPDKGLYDAMNKGIKIATGEIVGILNSDDVYFNNAILAQVANTFNQNNSIQAIFGNIRFVRPDNLDKTVRYYQSKHFSPKCFRFGFMPAHPTFFTYRTNFDKIGFYKTDYKIAADFELLTRFLYKNKLSYKYIPLDFIKMRTGGISTKSYKSNIILNREMVRACKENGIYTNLIFIFSKYLIKIFEWINLSQKEL